MPEGTSLMDAGERALVADTVRDAITGLGDASTPDGVDAVLEDLGWLDLLAAEPDDAIAIVATTLGAANGHATVLDDVVLRALGLEPRSELAVLLPAYGSWDRPNGHGLTTARLTTAEQLLVASDQGAVLVPASRVRATPIRGINPGAGLLDVVVEERDGDGVALAPGAWEDAVAWARRTLAYDMLGATRTMLDLAREHARDRVQFDRPIARFQAVRHRLAEALVAIEALDAALGAARDEPNPQTAALAKAIAGRTARTVATHCQQVLAGIGFTTEHPYHRFLKRTVLLDGLFGSPDGIVRDVGRTLLATRTVPTLIEL